MQLRQELRLLVSYTEILSDDLRAEFAAAGKLSPLEKPSADSLFLMIG
jgi:hypothetical protein